MGIVQGLMMSYGRKKGREPGANTLAYYKMDGNANDSSGNSLNGTASGVDWVAGRLGSGSARFNATTDKIDMGNVLDNDGTTPMTISLWFNLASNGANTQRILISKQLQGGNFTGYAISLRNTNLVCWSFVSTVTNLAEKISVGTVTNYGVWNNLVCTYDGSKNTSGLLMYLNGLEFASVPSVNSLTGSTSSTASLIIGNRATTFNASSDIDEVIIENRVWTATEVQEYYTYASGKFGIQ